MDLDAYRRVNQFFQLVIERDETMPEEELIDQEADPWGGASSRSGSGAKKPRCVRAPPWLNPRTTRFS